MVSSEWYYIFNNDYLFAYCFIVSSIPVQSYYYAVDVSVYNWNYVIINVTIPSVIYVTFSEILFFTKISIIKKNILYY